MHLILIFSWHIMIYHGRLWCHLHLHGIHRSKLIHKRHKLLVSSVFAHLILHIDNPDAYIDNYITHKGACNVWGIYEIVLSFFGNIIIVKENSVIKTRLIYSQILKIDTTLPACEGEIWDAYCEFNIWFMFCANNYSAVYKSKHVILYRVVTALKSIWIIQQWLQYDTMY